MRIPICWFLGPLLLSACHREPEAALTATDPSPTTAAADFFVEKGLELGLDFRHVSGATGELYYPETVPPGVALFDYDNDGDLDVYLVQGGSPVASPASAHLPDRLFRNDLIADDDGGIEPRLVDVTAAAGLSGDRPGPPAYGMGVAVADVDNDGWLDVYVTHLGPDELWINRGDGTFREAAAAAGVDDRRWNTSASFADYDRDGWPDLFVSCYKEWNPALHRTCRTTTGAPDYCSPASFLSTPDRLFRNRGAEGGGIRFEDVTASAGLLGDYGAGLGVVSADLNGDGWPDFYVANDQDPNFFWVNLEGASFIERALLAGVAVNNNGLAEGSMGVDAGDADNDGDLDLFMTHFRDETNTLYLNTGRGVFRDATNVARLGQPSRPFTGFGTVLLDFDNDGWLDVAVANGRVNVDDGQRLAGEPLPLKESNQLFRNVAGSFEDVSARASAAFLEPAVGRGLAVGDLDLDGDPDLLVANAEGRPGLFVNRVGQDSGWLGVRPATPALTPVVGVELRLTKADDTSMFRVSRADGSYLSANDPRVLFGLGRGVPRRLEITWPDRRRERWELAVSGRYLTFFAE